MKIYFYKFKTLCNIRFILHKPLPYIGAYLYAYLGGYLPNFGDRHRNEVAISEEAREWHCHISQSKSSNTLPVFKALCSDRLPQTTSKDGYAEILVQSTTSCASTSILHIYEKRICMGPQVISGRQTAIVICASGSKLPAPHYTYTGPSRCY